MTGTVLSSEGLDLRRRRLLFRSWHRGIREMDLILGRFAEAVLADLAETDVADYEQLLEVPDPDLYGWVTGATPVSRNYDTDVFRRLRAFHCLPAGEP